MGSLELVLSDTVIGSRTSPAILQAGESARVIGVSDIYPAKLAVSKRLHSEIVTTPDFRDLLQDPRNDAVPIATPVHTHYDLALSTLKAGKHVFVEKPLAPTSDQARRLIDQRQDPHFERTFRPEGH